MSSSFVNKPWKRQIFGLTIATALGLCTASSVESATNITQTLVQQVQTSTNSRIGTSCCTLLKLSLGSLVSTSESTAYQSSISSYWSVQAQSVDPWCVVSPTTTVEVSRTVSALNLLRIFEIQCPFAIRSGGHTPWAGSSSIQDGVQIDLAAINQVTVASDQKTTSIGPGAKWLDVYIKLDALNLTVPGGRVATVGVGGLVTGGGISFFSARYGLTVDNVANFEIVLYDGSVVLVNSNSRPDLFLSLKGGSNNFGVVTRIDLMTYDQGKFWGGSVVWPISTKNESLAAFVNFTGQSNYDTYGALIHSYAWTAENGWIIDNNIIYTNATIDPPVFQEMLAIQPQYQNTMRISNLSDFTIELTGENSYSTNDLFYTSTWSNDLETLSDIVSLSQQYVQTVENATGLVWSLTFQPLVTAITTKGAATGGNALGLNGSEGNLVLALVTASYTNPADDAAVLKSVTDFFTAADTLAASRGRLHSYRYLNYAYKTQNPITGYGNTSIAKLRAASKKYDPAGVFQTLVPGGFKLWN